MKSVARSRPWCPPRSAFAGYRNPAEVIVVAVRWYLRYGLSYRDVEELLAERGIDVDHGRGQRASDGPFARTVCRRRQRRWRPARRSRLTDSGRRRIATIAGPQDDAGAIDRLAGYLAEMQDHNHRPIVEVGDFTRDSGSVAMRELLTDDPHLEAVFVASDLMAHGALRTLRQAGRRVPDDVAVIGFDDIDVARYTEPALTTVRVPILDIGRTMARQVLRLAGGEAVEPSIVLATEVAVREST